MQLAKDIFKILSAAEKKRLTIRMILDVVTSVLDIAFLAALLYVIKFYTESSHSFPIKQWSNFFNEYPLAVIVCFFILFSLKNFIGYIVYQGQAKFTYAVASRLSKESLENYLDGSFSDHVNIDSSVQMRKIGQQPIEFSYYILGGFQQIVSQLLLILIAVTLIIIYNPVLFFLLIAILAPPIFIVALWQKRKLSNLRKNAEGIKRQAIQHLQEALAGFVESALFHCRNFFTERFYSSQRQLNNFQARQQAIQNLPSRFIEVFAIFGLFILIVLNRSLTNANSVQLVTLGAFLAAAYKIIPGIVKIINTTGQIKTYKFTIIDLLDKKDTENAEDIFCNIRKVTFTNVSFSYKDHSIFNDLSFTIEGGDFVGIKGISGKGKTTLVNLLLGFLSPEKGEILINNISQELIKVSAVQRISYVKQQPFFIHDTAARNVLLTNTAYDEQKFEEVTNVAEFKTFINGSLHKTIKENGKNISGGQRQRIALARGLYKDFDLLILDEPFSELDAASETNILRKLKLLTQEGKMILLITHNPSSFIHCNKIISLDE